ncbi:hypothetical protein HJG54_29605 [Leptolyngbya sp. NK1-12]|uniref:Tachylectin 2 domain-containing protein n=1 Tax=Leptolyngbya sp. NK1-12 TaxID=2547451 RepID=A0AA97AIU7_9CYAN|nr:hypothetical protein HJG54_29605 [Leptolyngbya sp. NK1-12]
MAAITVQPITVNTIKSAFADISGNGVIYTITSEGSLKWYKYIGQNGDRTWAPGSGSVIPGTSGWQPFKSIFSGGNGVIYAIRTNGDLECYKDIKQDGSGEFLSGTIGVGWSQFKQVFSGGNGVIYAITSDGKLLWYRDKKQNGQQDWEYGTGKAIGNGWGNYKFVFPGGNGTIYAITVDGDLLWFNYVAQDGSPGFAVGSGQIVSQGWADFRSVFAGGNGVIYGITENGELRWYKDITHRDKVAWASGSGNAIDSGWSDAISAFSSGNGVIYKIDSNGHLKWHKDMANNGTMSWDANYGKDLGGGWNTLKNVFADLSGDVGIYATGDDKLLFYKSKDQASFPALSGDPQRNAIPGTSGWQGLKSVFSGGNGVIYGIFASGELKWYKDTVQDGTAAFAGNSGAVVGSDWAKCKHVLADGKGSIFAVADDGKLLLYLDSDQNGTPVFAPAYNVVGMGWANYKHVFSGGNGIIYAITNDGKLLWHRFAIQTTAADWDPGSDNVINDGWVFEDTINVMNRGNLKLVSEVTNLAVTPTYDPLLSLSNSDAADYINYTELNSIGVPSSFNNIEITYSNTETDASKPPQYKPSIQPKDIYISGLVLNWKSDLGQSVLRAVFVDNNGKPRIDIQNLYMYADTVIIGRELHFPQTNVTIYARRLIIQGNGKIDTTPLAFKNPYPSFLPNQDRDPAKREPKYATNAGADGASAGNITLYVKQIEGGSQTTPWLILNGSDGQKGEKGGVKTRDAEKDKLYVPVQWSDVLEGVLNFDLIKGNQTNWHWPEGMHDELQSGYVGGITVTAHNPYTRSRDGTWRSNSYGLSNHRGVSSDKRHPQSGADAYPSGIAGVGGNGGILATTVQLSGYSSEQKGGKGGLSEFVAGSEPAAGAKPLMIRSARVIHISCTQEFWDRAGGLANTEVGRINARKGDDYAGSQARSGESGRIKLLSTEQNIWLHPNLIDVVLQYAKDMFLKGDRRPAKWLLPKYQVAFKKLSASENSLLLNNLQHEVDLIRSRATANVDYFGNLLGWTPRLASVTQVQLFNDILPGVAKVLYFCQKLLRQDSQNQMDEQSASAFINYLSQRIQAARTSIQSSMNDLSSVQSEINSWQSEVERITHKIKDLHDEIVVNEKINAEHQAILKGALQICSGIVKCIPYGQPYLGEAAGGVLEAFSNIDLSGSSEQLAADSLKGFKDAGANLGGYITKNKKDLSTEATSDLTRKIDEAQGDLSKVDKDIADLTKKADKAVKDKFGAQISLLNSYISAKSSIRNKSEFDYFYSKDYGQVLADLDQIKKDLEKTEQDADVERKNKLTAETRKLLGKKFSELETEQKDLVKNLKTLKQNKEARTKTVDSALTKVASIANGTGQILGGISTIVTPIDVTSKEFEARVQKIQDTKYKAVFKELNEDVAKFSAKKQKAMAQLLDLFDAINTAGQHISSSLIQTAQLSEQRSQSIQNQLLPSTQLFLKRVMQDAKELLTEQTYYLIKSYEYAYLQKCPLTDAYNMGKVAEEIANKISPGQELTEAEYVKYFVEVIQVNFIKFLMEILEKTQYEGNSPISDTRTIVITDRTELANGSRFLDLLNQIVPVSYKLDDGTIETFPRRQVTFKLHELKDAGNTPTGGEVLSRIKNIKFNMIETSSTSTNVNFDFALIHSGDSIIRDFTNTDNFYFFTSKTPETNEKVVLPVRTWGGTYESTRTPEPIVESISSGHKSDEELLNALLKQFGQSSVRIDYKEAYPGATSDLTLIVDQRGRETTPTAFKITKIVFTLEYECIPLSRLKKPTI